VSENIPSCRIHLPYEIASGIFNRVHLPITYLFSKEKYYLESKVQLILRYFDMN